MSKDPIQKRTHRRYQVKNLRGSLLFRIEVTVLNLSMAGIAVETSRQLKLGKVYSVKLGGGPDSVDVEATVKWCHLVGTRRAAEGEMVPVYKAGLTFEELFTGKTAKLLAFMQEHVVLALEKRIIGRFKLKTGSPIALASRHDFEVVTLGLSGMVVKTKLLPDVDSAFDMELQIGGNACELTGRIAKVQRLDVSDSGFEAQLDVEFPEEKDDWSRVVREFIAEELE
jgi:hypothetical protein